MSPWSTSVAFPWSDDAFGAALTDALEHGESRVVIERDDGLVTVDEIGPNYFGAPDTWAERCRWAVAPSVACSTSARARTRHALRCRTAGKTSSLVSARRSVRARGVRQRFLGTVDDLRRRRSRSTPSSRSATASGSWKAASSAGVLARSNVSATRIRSSWAPVSTRTRRRRYCASPLSRSRTASGVGCRGQVTIRVRYRELATTWFDLLWCSLDELAEIVERRRLAHRRRLPRHALRGGAATQDRVSASLRKNAQYSISSGGMLP